MSYYAFHTRRLRVEAFLMNENVDVALLAASYLFTDSVNGMPYNLDQICIAADRIPGRDVSLHHHRLAGAIIASGFCNMRLKNGHARNCS